MFKVKRISDAGSLVTQPFSIAAGDWTCDFLRLHSGEPVAECAGPEDEIEHQLVRTGKSERGQCRKESQLKRERLASNFR